MKPLTLHEGDDEKPDGKEKKKADKGKAVYRDPWVVGSPDVKMEEKREVEPSKFIILHLGDFEALLRLTQE